MKYEIGVYQSTLSDTYFTNGHHFEKPKLLKKLKMENLRRFFRSLPSYTLHLTMQVIFNLSFRLQHVEISDRRP